LATAPAPVKASKEVRMPKLSVLLGVWPKLVFENNTSATVVKNNSMYFFIYMVFLFTGYTN